MNPAIKIVVAILVAALIAVVGLIVVTQNNAKDAALVAATTPVATEQPQETAAPEMAEEPIPEGTDMAYTEEAQTGADNEALHAEGSADEEAQGTMYEGALAGLTEEEIAALALAEEQHSSADMSEDDGQEGPID